MKGNSAKISIYKIAAVSLLVMLLLAPIWTQHGLPATADGPVHLYRVGAIQRSHQAHVLWARWFPEVYQGLGSPVFHYYAPFLYHLIASFSIFHTPIDEAAKAIITLTYVLGAFALFVLLERFGNAASGITGVAIYFSQPAFYREFYFQGDYPQWFALLWLPVVLFLFLQLYQRNAWKNYALASASFALLFVSHNITAMLGTGFLAIFLLLFALSTDHNWKGVGRLILAGLLGLGLSAFFWVPAIFDMPLTHVGRALTGDFGYFHHFVPFRDLLAAPPLLDSRAGNPVFPHMLGWLALGSVVLSLFILLRYLVIRRGPDSAERGLIVAGMVTAVMFVLLTTSLSVRIWQYFPPLQWLQFPSRFLGPATLGIAIATGSAFGMLRGRALQIGVVIILISVFFCTGVFLFPRQQFARYTQLDSVKTQQFEVASGTWGSAANQEFLPRWADIKFSAQPDLIQEARNASPVKIAWQDPHHFSVIPKNGRGLPDDVVSVPVHYFPAWQAEFGGEAVHLQPDARGLISFLPPRGATKLIIRWTGTPMQRLGEWISVITVFLLIAGGVIKSKKQQIKDSPEMIVVKDGNRQNIAGVYQAALFSLFVCFAVWGVLSAFHQINPFFVMSASGEVAGMQHPLGVRLGGGEQPEMILRGWDQLYKEPLSPGGHLRVRLYWDIPRRIHNDLDSFVHLYSPELKKSWVVGKYSNVQRIPATKWQPGFYYIDELELTLPRDLPPLSYTLVAGMVDEQGDRLKAPDNSDGLIFLGKVRVEPLPARSIHSLSPGEKARAVFDQRLELEGYDLLPDPGGPILRLYWHPLKQSQRNWTLFIHLLDSEQNIIAQYDGPPFDGLYPTTEWQPGSIMVDARKLYLPDGKLAGGTYTLLIGLYDAKTGERASLQPKSGYESHFTTDALRITFVAP